MFEMEKKANQIIQSLFRKNVMNEENELDYWERIWSNYIDDFEKRGILTDIEDMWWKYSYDEMHLQYKTVLNGFKDMTICELGCGTGYSSLLMCKEGANITLVDFSTNAKRYNDLILKYLKINEHNVNFIISDAYSKNLDIGKFDLVWNCGVLEHYNWYDALDLVKVMMKHVKSNGKVMITIPNQISPQIIYLNLSKGKGTEIYYSYRMLKKLMIDVGLVNVEVLPLNYWVPSFFPHFLYKNMRKIDLCKYFKNLSWLFTGIGTKK